MSLRPTLPPACLFTPVIIVTVDISGGALSPPSVFAKSSSLVHRVRTNVAAIPLPLFDGKNEGGGSHASAPPRQRSRSRSDVMYQLQSSTCIGRCSHVNQRGLPTLLCVQPFIFSPRFYALAEIPFGVRSTLHSSAEQCPLKVLFQKARFSHWNSVPSS